MTSKARRGSSSQFGKLFCACTMYKGYYLRFNKPHLSLTQSKLKTNCEYLINKKKKLFKQDCILTQLTEINQSFRGYFQPLWAIQV